MHKGKMGDKLGVAEFLNGLSEADISILSHHAIRTFARTLVTFDTSIERVIKSPTDVQILERAKSAATRAYQVLRDIGDVTDGEMEQELRV